MVLLSMPLHAESILDLSEWYPIETCALLAQPGDIILQKIVYDAKDPALGDAPEDLAPEEVLEFGWGIVYLHRLKNIFNLWLPSRMEFSHSEIITEIEKGKNLVTWSFYPPIFSKNPESPFTKDPEHEKFRRYANHSMIYRRDFSVYRVGRGSYSLDLREKALEKVSTQASRNEYAQMGTCSDFVAQAFQDRIYPWWNFLPGVRDLVNAFYPAVSISSPDDLARSPETRKICEVSEKTKLSYPSHVPTETLLNDLKLAVSSSNESISKHAKFTILKLIELGAVSMTGDVLLQTLAFLSDHDVAFDKSKEKTASQEEKAQKKFLNYR